MGSEISSFVIEPIIGGGAVALAIFAIIEQNKDEDQKAKWLSIAAVVVVILLIVINIVLTVLAG